MSAFKMFDPQLQVEREDGRGYPVFTAREHLAAMFAAALAGDASRTYEVHADMAADAFDMAYALIVEAQKRGS